MGITIFFTLLCIGLFLTFLWGAFDIDLFSSFVGTAVTALAFGVIFGKQIQEIESEANFILDPIKKEIVFDDGSKLRIYQYEVSKFDSLRVKIKANDTGTPPNTKNNEFTNFN